MSLRPSMFSTIPSSSTSLPVVATSHNKEISLRDEMNTLMYGPNGDGIGRKSYPILIRRMRRTDGNYPDYCTCSASNGGKHADKNCSYCQGEGYLFDEIWGLTYSQFAGPDGGKANRYIGMPPGDVRVDYKIFYFAYDVNIDYLDKIIEVKLDKEGVPASPIVRMTIYKPETIDDRRADDGRLEFWQVYCREKDAIKADTYA